ncbi:MAG: DUF6655 family protein [Pirellulales bacterium]
MIALLAAIALCGCGTTRWTDTSRTATEQLLISDAIDRAVQEIDFNILTGQDIFLETKNLNGVTDQGYLIGTLRQHMLASGCILKEKREDATYVVEPRVGAVGTDRHDLLYGLPATNLGAVVPIPGVPSSVPEIPLAKRTDQLAVAKLAVFAYERETGAPVWQSGVAREKSNAKDFWVFGAGPFQKGTIYQGTSFAGQRITNPLIRRTPEVNDFPPSVSVTEEALFSPRRPAVASKTKEPPADAAPPESQAAAQPAPEASNSAAAPPEATAPETPAPKVDEGVVPASATEPIEPAAPIFPAPSVSFPDGIPWSGDSPPSQ